ncbi:MAG: efflux RND transporter permease subunit [Candidatus Gracilibacteria bacterium]|nr:efflux RND transporter permease subunit [Candidatus Gracilibacteria bacterium]
MSRIKELREKTLKGFFGFWIKQYRISYLIILVILIIGFLSLLNIPKESSPSIKFGMISISTSYPGTNPNDMDSLVTDKIYKEIKDIKGIDKITESSSLGFSSVLLTLKAGADTKEILNEVRNDVNKVILPTDAKTPVVTEIDTDTKQAFSVYLYSNDKNASKETLINKANIIKNNIEKAPTIDSVDFASSNLKSALGSSATNGNEYDIEIVIPPEKLKSSGLTIDSIASTIKAWNKDIPVGNFYVGNKKYDFRIEGKYTDSIAMLDIPIELNNGNFIKLGDIANIERVYIDKSITLLGNEKINGLPYVSLVVNKIEGTSIFAASKEAKQIVEDTFKTEEFKNFGFVYGNDIADNIMDDYKELAKEAITTLSLVFIAMYLFVGFKDSLFATITLPLAFLSTFIILYYGGFTLNFLTNFSLILSFGIAVDTIIVIVQAASAKMRVGYDPETSVMLALKEYAIPIISGVMSTIVAFVPMMFLPGVMGKFLAYIPITIFGVLACGLVLALTVNSALYLLFVKKQKKYVHDDTAIEYASDEEKELLYLEREGKEELGFETTSLRVKVIHKCTQWYKKTLSYYLQNTFLRRIFIIIPVILLVLSFIFLAPLVGFELFPSADNNYLTASIEGENGLKTEVMYDKVKNLDKILGKYKEINYYTISVKNNSVSVTVQLFKKAEREKLKERSVFEIEKLLSKDLEIYENMGLKVTTEALKSGPGGSKAVGIKLTTEKSEQLSELIDTAKIFEKKLKTIPGTKSVELSSQDTPGQFIFTLRKDVLGIYGIPPAAVYGYIIQMMNGINVGAIEDNGSDMDIYIKQENFREDVNIEDILNSTFTYAGKTYQIGNLIEYNTKNSIASISREDGKIIISVEADLEKGVDTVGTQTKFEDYAKTFEFPNGISYMKGGENEENKELIVAVLSSFFLAIMVIFTILTLQFNSYSQPLIILYSVIMSLPFVMLGLLLTGNSFSLPFGIGFISFTGIAVNHGIILIDAININLNKGMNSFTALVEAGSSRLEPMTLTTFTTALGILPIALRDQFWSGMGFTIIFGIISASTLTLFVLKGVYYEVYLKMDKKNKRKKV